MSKKLMLLAFAAVSAILFAMPALASAADEPLHLNPTPASAVIDNVTVGNPNLTTTGGSKIECTNFSGNATFEAGGTTGNMTLTFSGSCHDVGTGASCNSTGAGSGTITTTSLPFHLLTLPNSKPGVLVTPNADGSFAHIECGFGLIKFTVDGTGAIGTITEPACSGTSNMATVKFLTTGNGLQEHTTVAGTPTTEYTMTRSDNGQTAAQFGSGTLTLKDSNGNAVSSKLECT